MGRRVATIAQYASEDRPARAPISAHPAFPAIVALWFAALLGLGSLVLPVVVIEKLVTVSGIAALIPAAEPPLGFTARAGIALAAAIAGALVGLALARKVAAASAPEPRARGFSLGADRQCRPISAHEELGEDGLDSPDAAPTAVHKRRSLAMAEDDRPSAYLQAVPLPGQTAAGEAEQPSAEAQLANEPAAVDASAEADPEPLELGVFSVSEDEADAQLGADEAADGLEALRLQIHRPDDSATPDSPMTDLPSRPAAFASRQRQEDPLPFAAPSLRRSLAPAFDEDEETDIPQEDEIEDMEVEDVFADEPTPQLTVVEPDGQPDADDRPVEELGLVQLAARLGASIEKRRAWLAQRQTADSIARPPVSAFADPDDFAAAEAEDAARAIADFFGPANTEIAEPAEEQSPVITPKTDLGDPIETPTPVAMPASLRGVPIDLEDEGDEDDLAASFALPLGGSFSGIDESDTSDEEQFDEEEPDDSDYSSLLAMKNPFVRQQEFVRVDEPEDESGSIEPAVTFPSAPATAREDTDAPQVQPFARPFDPPKTPVETALRAAPAAAPRDPGDAERSLRDALATLQRMSGAA